jgi:RNA polymerase sigma factor (sigma-70 family)
MAKGQLEAVLRHIRVLAAGPTDGVVTDGALLRAFLATGDQAVFEALVHRHGPMVLRVCRRALGHEQDAEDAFQATFLVLARKASSVRKRESLASWLHGVAYRMATHAKRAATRRHKHEAHASPVPPRDPAVLATWREFQTLLDEEIAGLPEALRAPFISCCLENRCSAEVAQQLGLGEAAVRKRLSRARKVLAERLSRRGVSLMAVLAAAALGAGDACAALPRSVVTATAKAAAQMAAGHAAAGVGGIPPKVAALTQGVLRTMFTTKLKTATAALLAAGLLVAGLLAAGRSATPRAALAQVPAARDKGKAKDAHPAGKGTGRLRLRATLKGHDDAVLAVAFSPDGKLLASASQDTTIKIWDTATGKEVKSLAGSPDAVEALAFSADGKMLASSTGGHFGTRGGQGGADAVKIWDVASGEEKVPLKDNEGQFDRVAFSPDGKVLAAGFLEVVGLWDTATGKKLATIKNNGPFNVNDSCLLAFSRDSKTLVMGSGAWGGEEAPIHLWNWPENKSGGSLRTEGRCVFAAFTADGKTLATLNTHGDLTLWDFDRSRERSTVKLATQGASAAALSANGKVLALTYFLQMRKGKFIEPVGKVELLDTARGKILASIPLDTAGQCAAFSPKGRMLAVGCRGKEQYPAGPGQTFALGRNAEGDLGGVVRIWGLRDPTARSPRK